MAIQSETPKIYFNRSEIDNLSAFVVSAEPAHERIGALFHRLLAEHRRMEKSGEDMDPFWQRLGVDPTDESAKEAMADLLMKMEGSTLKISTTDNTGVYFIKKQSSPTKKTKTNDPIAVFKIGRKRAAMETMVRRLAKDLGLDKHMVPGMFCALLNPSLNASKDDETVEELWNGREKIYRPAPAKAKDEDELLGFGPLEEEEEEVQSTASAVVGIVQPFIADPKEKASLFDFTLMTMLAIAIGARDLKIDGYKGSTLFDVEDCMGVRIDPVWTPEQAQKTPSALDLPYLDRDERAQKPLSAEEISKLAEIVQKWDIIQIVSKLKALKIRFEDKIAEKAKPNEKAFDEGNCYFKTRKAEPHLINGRLNHMEKANDRHMLTSEQINTCNTRLTRIRDFILKCAFQKRTFSPQELVFAVDPFGEILHHLIRRSPMTPMYEQVLNSSGPNSLSGRCTPNSMNIKVSSESLSWLITDDVPSRLVQALEQVAAQQTSDQSLKSEQ